jgi:bacteriocin biosynthesis cyclodehydratase domain-containing protein
MRIIFAGEFGSKLAERLALQHKATLVPWSRPSKDDPLTQWDGEFVVFALDRPYPAALQALDAQLIKRRVRWTAAFIRDRHLYCGPLHEPGRGACWGCFQRRYLSLTAAPRTPERERALDAVYDRADGSVLPGFLPSLVSMAAAKVSAHALGEKEYQPGALTSFDVLEGGVITSRVIPLHGCDCRFLSSTKGEDRFTRALSPLVNT